MDLSPSFGPTEFVCCAGVNLTTLRPSNEGYLGKMCGEKYLANTEMK